MTKEGWKKKIKKACQEAGTYEKYFDQVIDALSDILEKRDIARTQFECGEEPLVIEVAGKGMIKNPLVRIIEDMSKLALQYWRELGLTPSGLKKLNEDSFAKAKENKPNTLLGLLAEKRMEK